MTDDRTARRWGLGGLVLGALVVVVAAAGEWDATSGEAVVVALPAFEGSAPDPEVSVDPATDLTDHQVVEVHGEGFDPDSGVQLVQCPGGGAICKLDFAEVDEDGSFDRAIGVAASGDETPGTDCRRPGTTCVLSVQTVPASGDLTPRGTVPLEFDPDESLAPTPTLRASPVTGLSDGDLITVSGEGHRPGAGLHTVVCASPDPADPGCLDRLTGGFADLVDETGELNYPFRATAVIGTGDDRVDCRTEACYLHLNPLEPGARAFPLRFRTDRPLASPPDAFALVVEGRDLHVQGEDFLPGEEVYIGVCIRADGTRRCQAPSRHRTVADADGAIDVVFTPEPFEGFDGVADCRGARCWVWLTGVSSPSREPLRAPFALDP